MTRRGAASRALRITVLVALLTLVMPLPALSVQPQASSIDTLWVDAVNGNDAWDGTEAEPFKTITHALLMADSLDTIMVEPGTYDVANGETFPLAVYGETLMSTGGSDVTVIEGDGAHGVVSAQGYQEGDALSGFTITGGVTSTGGGILVYLNSGIASDGWPLIANNAFDSNEATSAMGGAVRMFTSAPIQVAPAIVDNVFEYNTGHGGGAVALTGYVDATLEGNVFYGNMAASNSGGAVQMLTTDSTVTVSGNAFIENQSTQNGGAFYASVAGGHLYFADNEVYENAAGGSGGALWLYGLTVDFMRNDCGGNDANGGNGGFAVLDHTTADAENNVIGGCSASGSGAMWYLSQAALHETNDTIVDGFTADGATYAGPDDTLEISNCIYWNPELIDVENADMIEYSCVRDEDVADVTRGNTVGSGVIFDNPSFIDLDAHDARLALGSPCIDAGDLATAAADDFFGTTRPQDGDGDGTALPDMGYFEKPTIEANELAGADRYATAVQIASETFATAEYAIIASGQNYPDALSAAGLAGAYECPLVLTKTATLPAVTADFLESRGVEHVFIIGGEAAVGADVYDELAADYDVQRIAGADRYDTAAQVAGEIATYLGEAFPPVVFVARGDSFPDALSLSPLSFANGIPILLTKPTSLPGATADALDGLGIEEAVIAGGTGAVSEQTKAAIDTILVNNGGIESERWSGDDRYATAVEIAIKAAEIGFATWDTVGIATGQNYPDALAGGVSVGMGNGVVLLTKTASLPDATADALYDYAYWIMYVDIFGGTSAVSDAVRADINDALGW